ncbi:MAG: SAM-dependent methyltransferase [Planctomycetia bacterium]|nr:SAM-dependent methyltransferase [Planctomycetia bacterium]
MEKVFGSFRDPAGGVFVENDRIYRAIYADGVEDYRLFVESGLAKELLKKKWIPEFQEVDPARINGAEKVIEVERLPWISCPYEWSFHQLKEAALFTLKLQIKALDFNMTLKDASAYNIQLLNARPVMIDLQSFERYEEGTPWNAYRQFVMHFLGPLLLMARDVRYGQLFRAWLDGFPIDFTSKQLPRRSWLSFACLLHIHLHARMIAKYENTRGKSEANREKPSKPVSKSSLYQLLDSLVNFVKSIRSAKMSTEWGDYYNDINYSDSAFKAKKALIEEICRKFQPARVCDLGANCGEFSRQVPDSVPVVISADIDPVAVDKNYIQVRKNDETSIYPVLIDLCNPSPSLGWMNGERDSFLNRARCDVALGLALIHHLCIGNNLPLRYVAQLFDQLAPVAVVEFVPKDDSQTQRLLSAREDIFPEYTLERCVQVFGEYFPHCETHPVPDSKRTILVFSK